MTASGDLRAAAFWVLALGVALAPLASGNWSALGVGAPLLYSAYVLPKLLVLSASVLFSSALWSLSAVLSGRGVRWAGALLALLVFCASSAVATAASLQPLVSLFGTYARLDGLLTTILHALVFFLALQLVDSDESMRSVSAIIAAAGALSAAYGLLQLTPYDPFKWYDSRLVAFPYAMLRNRDFLGGLLVMPLVLSAANALSARRIVSRAFWWTAASVIAACLLVTLVRGAWLGALLGSFALLALYVRAGVGGSRRLPLGIAAVSLTALGVALLSGARWGMESSIAQRALSITQLTSGSIQTRIMTYQVAARSIVRHLIWGLGPGDFSIAWWRYAGLRELAIEPIAYADNAHSMPIQWATTVGVLGAIAGVLAVGLVLMRGVRATNAGSSGHHGIDGLAASAGMWAALLGASAFLITGFDSIEVVAIFWLGLGALAGTSNPRVCERKSCEYTASAVVITLALGAALVTGAWVSADRLVARAVITGTVADVTSSLEQAVRRAPWVLKYRLLYANQLSSMAQPAIATAQTARTPEAVATARQAVGVAEAAFAQAARVAPYDPEAYVLWAAMLDSCGTTCGTDVAQRQLSVARRAMRALPYGEGPRLLAAQAALRLGRPTQARAVLEDAWLWPHVGVRPGLLYVQSLAGTDRQAALKAARLLVKRFPQSDEAKRLLESP